MDWDLNVVFLWNANEDGIYRTERDEFNVVEMTIDHAKCQRSK